MMNYYKIAVIIAGIDQSYQSSVLSGIESSASEYSLDIDIFVSFSGIMGNQKHDTGEFNIFKLPDFTGYDGAILLTNTIAYQPVIENIFSSIKAAGIPAVSIDNDIRDFYYIGSDNRKAMHDITDHFIRHHGINKLNYISGPADNPESSDRLAGFMDALHENCIEIESERIYYGDFRAPCGRLAVKSFLKSELDMPQAIVCANDVMAVSAMEALADAGYKIPGDICISGFDNTYSSGSYPIELTSVDRPLKHSGSLACRILYNHFAGVSQERRYVLDMQTEFTESCGCERAEKRGLDDLKKLNYENYEQFETSFSCNSFINRMSCKLSECYDLDEYVRAIKPFIAELDPQELYICLCSDWNNNGDENLPPSKFREATFTVDGYTEMVTVPIAYRKGDFLEISSFPSGQVLPGGAGCNERGRFFYIVPLHFGERCLGYMAVRNPNFPVKSSMFQTWCIVISNSIESVRKIINLDHAVKRLDRLYTIDMLTGINNRNGFAKNTAEPYRKCIESGSTVMLMFIDLDGLKKINDTYGHDNGDRAIRDIADVLILSCTNGEVFGRFGGDEFIVFGADLAENDAVMLCEKIKQNIAKINSGSQNPFILSASIGYYIAMADEGIDIFEFVTMADHAMYKEKKKQKRSKYLKS